MRRYLSFLLLAVLVAIALAPMVSVSAARIAGPVILVDLAHGENTNGLCTLFATMPEAHWIVLVPSEGFKLPECGIRPAEVWVGDFAKVADKLRDVDMVIIGQPTKYLSDDEIKVLKEWFQSSGKVLWCAGDSDYPAQGGVQEIADHACDAVLKAIGSKLRLDFVSIEDTKSNAGRPYRVVGIVEPDSRYGAEVIAYGAKKVLFHGPGAVAWVDENGKWHKLTEPNTPSNIVKLVLTTENGRVVEHQPKAPGAPGEFGRAHHVGETGKFVLMAAEVIEKGEIPNVVIVSGESPYGGYQPMVTYRYHGIPLDGPRFVRNVLLWALHYPAELAMIQSAAAAGEATKKAEEAMKTASEALNTAKQAASAAQQALSVVKSLQDEMSKLSDNVNKLAEAVNNLNSSIGTANTVGYAAIAIAIIAIAIAGAAIARKK